MQSKPPAAEKLPTCWGPSDALMAAYHDTEWGVPCHDDEELFERLMLEGFQAGLSWSTILNKRENFRRAFDGWAPERVAAYGPDKVASLLDDPGIVRNRLKVAGAVKNAQAFLATSGQFGTFDAYIWSFVGGMPLVQPAPQTWKDVPAKTPQSDQMSKALQQRGFTFVGSTICYAFMQSVGMVNDHLADCPARNAIPSPSGAEQARQASF
nr:DNA-3-methyladenine glycosylase [uncultured bacterium]